MIIGMSWDFFTACNWHTWTCPSPCRQSKLLPLGSIWIRADSSGQRVCPCRLASAIIFGKFWLVAEQNLPACKWLLSVKFIPKKTGTERMSLAPPPSRWQADDNYGSSNNQNEESSALILDSDGLAAKVVQAETANDAWRHVRALVASDARPMDLYDSLTQSGQDSIDPMPTGVWHPNFIRSSSPGPHIYRGQKLKSMDSLRPHVTIWSTFCFANCLWTSQTQTH